jgi:hypothetical protein
MDNAVRLEPVPGAGQHHAGAVAPHHPGDDGLDRQPTARVHHRRYPEARFRLDAALHGRRHFDYLYDFGDHWEHKLRIEKRLPPAPLAHPVCVGGANACPPEDVGGAPGYEDFLRIIQDPSHAEHEYRLEWCGGAFDPHAFDIDQVNRLLKHIKL